MIHRVHFCTKCGMMKMDRGEGMDAKKIGALIAQLRKTRGLTQKALAEKLHVSDKAVSRWETGVSQS